MKDGKGEGVSGVGDEGFQVRLGDATNWIDVR